MTTGKIIPITHAEFLELISRFEDYEIDDLSNDLIDFAYEGFSIATLIAAIQSKELNEEHMYRDIYRLIAMFLLRGNGMKVLDRSGDNGKKFLNTMKVKYGIAMGTGKKSLTNTTITYPRVAACFPIIVGKILQTNKIARPYDEVEIKNMPFWMRTSTVFSLIPKRWDAFGAMGLKRDLIKAALFFVFEETLVLNSRKRTSDNQATTIRSAYSYAFTAYSNTFYTDDIRISYIAARAPDLMTRDFNILTTPLWLRELAETFDKSPYPEVADYERDFGVDDQ